MYIGISSLRGRLFLSGNECLRYKIEFPVFAECDDINSFYLGIAQSCEKFCRERLLSELQARQNRGERYSYEMGFRVTHSDSYEVSILFCVRLRLGRDILFERAFANNWGIDDQQMIPPRILAKKYGGKRRGVKKDAGVFLSRGKLKFIENHDITDILSK